MSNRMSSFGFVDEATETPLSILWRDHTDYVGLDGTISVSGVGSESQPAWQIHDGSGTSGWRQGSVGASGVANVRITFTSPRLAKTVYVSALNTPAGASFGGAGLYGLVGGTWIELAQIPALVAEAKTFQINVQQRATAYELRAITNGTAALWIAEWAFAFDQGLPPEPPAPLWTPADSPNVLEWWNLRDPSKYTLVSGRMSQWVGSKNGTILAQSTSSRRPYFLADGFGVGKPAIQNQTNQFLETTATIPATWAGTNETWLWALASFTGSGLATIVGTGGSSSSNRRVIQRSSGGNPRIEAMGEGNNDNTLEPADWVDPWIVGGRFEGLGMRLRINGDWGEKRQEWTTQLSTSSTTRMRVFQSPNGSDADPWPGLCSDIVVCGPLFSFAEIQKLEGYYAWQNGVQALLTDGHPWKLTPPTQANMPLDSETFTASGGQKVVIYADKDLVPTLPNQAVTRAVIVIHGTNRNADDYFEDIMTASALANETLNTIHICPEFRKYAPATGYAAWGNENWKYGDPDTSLSLSSFDLIDQMCRLLDDKNKFPNMQRITITGHSAGGQFVQRYSAGNRIDPIAGNSSPITTPMRYCPSNPGSYMYLNNMRWDPPVDGPPPSDYSPGTGAWIAGYFGGSCSGYNTYRYGLSGLNAYMSLAGSAQIVTNGTTRDIRFLSGTSDTVTDSDLDTTCMGLAQGPNRYQRSVIYKAHVDNYWPSNTVQQIAIGGSEHDHATIFNSVEGRTAIFGI